MLRFLSIKRLAVIDAVEVEFGPGLNVLTGETGAGKSILVEAVGLLLGGRASSELVRTGEDLAVIEAIFESAGEEFAVRREITAQGRSRAFVNGALATAGSLKELCARVIELHGQHEHQTLLDPSTHLGVLDGFGISEADLTSLADAFDRLRQASEDLARTRAAAADRRGRQELLAFQLAEFERAAVKPREDEDLSTTRQILSNAERVTRLCDEGYSALYDSDAAALAVLGGVWRRVSELAEVEPQFRPYLEARDGIKAQLEDLAVFLRRYAEGIEASPERLQQIEDRLALLERLKRKYGPTLEEVQARHQSVGEELALLEQVDDRLLVLEAARQAARTTYLDIAMKVSTARRRLAIECASRVETMLSELAMDRTRFEVRFGPEAPRVDEGEWTRAGVDRVEFFVSPNLGEELRPLARVVSGGELSRIMLTMKTLTATSRLGFTSELERKGSGAAPSLVFDEVDAGIGGRVADIVGLRLHSLGSAFQVLCITHLPQIAAYADTHFHIEKHVEAGRTHTVVRRLEPEQRVAELGRMLGGTDVSSAVLASAREMLETRRSRGASEAKAKGESERAKTKKPTARRSS